MEEEVDELVDIVHKRQQYLSALHETPQTKRELTESFDVSRPTIDRAVRELAERNLVRRVDGEWTTTVVGDYLVEASETYRDRIRNASAVAPVLERFSDTTGIDSVFLDGVTVYRRREAVPDAIVEECFTSIEEATHVRGVVPIALVGHAREFYYRSTTDIDSRVEIILENDVISHFLQHFQKETREVVSCEWVDLYRADVPFRYGVWIADDDHAGVIVYSDDGIAAILKNDSPEAIAWANEVYERLRASADEVAVAEV